MYRRIILLFVIIFCVLTTYCQEGEAVEEGYLVLKRLFGDEEPILIPKFPVESPHIPELPTYSPGNYSHISNDRTVIVHDGEIVTESTAVTNGWVREVDDDIISNEPQTKITELNRQELRTYREYFSLKINSDDFYVKPENDVEIYDDNLIQKVKQFQQKNHLKIDGIIAGQTQKALNQELYLDELKHQTYLKNTYTAQDKKDAIIAFQAINDLPITGIFDKKTCQLLDKSCFPEIYTYTDATSFFRRGDEQSISSFYGYDKALISLGWGTEKQTQAQRALIIIKYQRTHSIPVTAEFDDITVKKIILDYQIDNAIPINFKTKGSKFRSYEGDFLKSLQEQNNLKPSGILTSETADILRPILDKSIISTILKIPTLHDDFVSLLINNSLRFDDIKFYFNDNDFDYFLLDNKYLESDKGLLGYASNRLTGEIVPSDVHNLLNQYEIHLNEIISENASKTNIINIGVYDPNAGTIPIQVGATKISITREELNNLISSQVLPDAINTAIKNSGNKPVLVFRPDFSLIGSISENSYEYESILGSKLSAVNPVKFAAALNKSIGETNEVYLVSDFKKALSKITIADKENFNPLFNIYVPNKDFFSPELGWKLDDYNIVSNLKARGINQNTIKKVPPDTKTTLNWKAEKGPKMFIGDKTETFQTFLMYRVETTDDAPVFLVSCFLPGDDSFISQWLYKNNMSNIIYFSEKIHPTVTSDVILQYNTLSQLPENKTKSFNELWKESIEITRQKNNIRYSPQMKLELNKLYNVIYQLTYIQKISVCFQNAA